MKFKPITKSFKITIAKKIKMILKISRFYNTKLPLKYINFRSSKNSWKKKTILLIF